MSENPARCTSDPTGTSTGTSTATLGYASADATSGLKRHVGAIGLLFAGVGSIIGSGWLFGAFNASTVAGPMAIVSWCVGAVMIMLIGLVLAELGSMFPVSGGVARFPHYSYGSFASFILGWVTWLAAAVVAPIEVLAAITYASSYAPWLINPNETLSWPGPAVISSPRAGCWPSRSSTRSASAGSRA